MSSSTVSIRTLLSHILFSFTGGVTEHCNPQQSKYTAAESHGYSPLESTGQEWYRHGDPDEECIYQEYRDSEATSFDHRARPISLAISFINASSTDETDENDEVQEDDEDENRSCIGSNSDHPLSEQFVNQCTLEL